MGMEVSGLKPGEFFRGSFCTHYLLLSDCSTRVSRSCFFHIFGFALYLLS